MVIARSFFVILCYVLCISSSIDAQTSAPPTHSTSIPVNQQGNPPALQGQQGWSQISVPTTLGLLYASSTQSDTVWAGAYLLKSNDRGVTWVHPNAPFSIAAISFYNSRIGCAIPGPTAYTTKDGGVTWDSALTGMNDIHALQVVTPDTIFASFLHQISRTTNGGRSWTATSLSALTINAISFSDSKHGFAVGNRQDVLPDSPQVASVFRTSDGGENWTLIYSGIKYALFGVAAVDDTTAYVVGKGAVSKTINGGKSWKETILTSAVNAFEGIRFRNRLEAIIVGDNGTIFYSDDGGMSWLHEQSGTAQVLYAATFIDDSTIIVVGEKGTVLRTTNKGLSWVSQVPTFQALTTVVYPEPFKASTTISYVLPTPQRVSLNVFDIAGRQVASLLQGILQYAGPHSITLHGSKLPAGVYTYQLLSEQYSATGKLTHLN